MSAKSERNSEIAQAPKRLPAFQFYVDAWLASVSVQSMPPEVEGTYMRLLCYQWKAVTLPTDTDQLRRLTKLDAKQWRKAWPMLEPHFPEVDGGRQNPTLYAIYQERLEFLEKQRVNGATGGRPAKPKAKPDGTQRKPNGFANGNPNETSVSGSDTELPLTPDGVTPLRPPETQRIEPPAVEPQPIGQPAPAPDPEQLALLRAAAMPHEALALDVLLHGHPHAYAIVAELHAIASGMHVHRGVHSGRQAEASDVMRAVSEYAAGGKPWNLRLFRGFVRSIADRKPEPPSTEEREAARLEREIAARAPAGVTIEQPRTVEELEATKQRVAEAMATFRRMAQEHRTSDPAAA